MSLVVSHTYWLHMEQSLHNLEQCEPLHRPAPKVGCLYPIETIHRDGHVNDLTPRTPAL